MSNHIQARIPSDLFDRLEGIRGEQTRTEVIIRALKREIRRMGRNARKGASAVPATTENLEQSQ